MKGSTISSPAQPAATRRLSPLRDLWPFLRPYRGRMPLAFALLCLGSVTILLVPLAFLFRYSLNQFVPGKFMVDALTIENYVKFFTDPLYLAVLWRTIRVAVVSTLVCLLFGFPLA